MTREDFEAIGGTITMVRRDPPETRWLAELPLRDGRTVRRRGPSAPVAIRGVLAECGVEEP